MNREQLFQARVDELGEEYVQKWATLTGKILSYGGEAVVAMPGGEVHIGLLLETGQPLLGPVTFLPGEPSNCHENSMRLWGTGQADRWASGYALSEDGLWRQHSVGLMKNGIVLETTVSRVAYFMSVIWDEEMREEALKLK